MAKLWFFRKPNNVVILYLPKVHVLSSLEDRFVECDQNGKDLKKEVKKTKKK